MLLKNKTFFFRIITEIIFLMLFAVLLYLGKIQLWLAVFGSGALLSLVFGRFYCGWMCPMNTLFRPIGWLYRKKDNKRIAVPRFAKFPLVRYFFLATFFAMVIATKRMGLELPHLGIIVAVSIPVTLFFEEALWHNHLCPYGTILYLTSRPATKSIKIDEEACISCGKCQKVCPAHAIDTLVSKKRFIRKTDCLTCHACETACPTGAIRYESRR